MKMFVLPVLDLLMRQEKYFFKGDLMSKTEDQIKSAEERAHEKKKQNLIIALAAVAGVVAAILVLYMIGQMFQ